MPDFFPGPDSELVTWSFDFSNEIPAVVTALGLPATTDDALLAARTAYATAFNDNLAKQNDADAARQAKDTARENFIVELRKLVRQLRGHPSFTDTQAEQLGLPVYDQTPGTPIAPVMNEVPELKVDTSVVQQHTIKFGRGIGLPRGKPSWARACKIVYAIVPLGQAAPGIPEMHILASHTASPFSWVIETQHVGKDIWYRGAWETPTGDIGGWSDPAKGTVTG